MEWTRNGDEDARHFGGWYGNTGDLSWFSDRDFIKSLNHPNISHFLLVVPWNDLISQYIPWWLVKSCFRNGIFVGIWPTWLGHHEHNQRCKRWYKTTYFQCFLIGRYVTGISVISVTYNHQASESLYIFIGLCPNLLGRYLKNGRSPLSNDHISVSASRRNPTNRRWVPQRSWIWSIYGTKPWHFLTKSVLGFGFPRVSHGFPWFPRSMGDFHVDILTGCNRCKNFEWNKWNQSCCLKSGIDHEVFLDS